MQTTSNPRDPTGQPAPDPGAAFRVGQRVHFARQPSRIGTVKYVGPVEGYSGDWIGVDWVADGEGKHDGSHNGVRYFTARGPNTASFVRPHNLSAGVSLLEALETRYRTASTKEEEDEMYVLSARNKRVSIELLGKHKIEDKLSRFEELTSASLSYLGVSFPGSPDHLSSTLPNIKELDLTGNLLSNWEDVGIVCEGLPALTTLNLSNNSMSPDIISVPQLSNIRILVLNQTGVIWKQVEVLKDSLPHVEELHLMGNKIIEITPVSSTVVQGFNSLRLLNLENNCLSAWDEIIKLSQLRSLEQIFLNNNNLNRLWYPDCGKLDERYNGCESHEKSFRPFSSLRGLSLGGNNIEDLESVDSLNSFPNLMIIFGKSSDRLFALVYIREIRLSENPVADLGKGGVPRFVFIARLAKIKILNGSEVSPRERKDSEIRYVRLVMSKFHGSPEEIKRLHPRFAELKKIHGLDDERPSEGASGSQTMASGLLSITLKCVGASMGEKPPLVKKLPATTTVGKLKFLCDIFFKLKSIKPILFLQEEGTPLPSLLDGDMATLNELGVGNESTILVDEQS
ncbi:hypothetical protein DH2020_049553 [Rehmannia glutinosa]|uniref:CAP-Gly domain-containing protein n=1 Tax=Rehmannia glutinosa TaxID=99300 RepID=A0ABR0U2L4_REHGL